jgi:hypothetical protein
LRRGGATGNFAPSAVGQRNLNVFHVFSRSGSGRSQRGKMCDQKYVTPLFFMGLHPAVVFGPAATAVLGSPIGPGLGASDCNRQLP